MPRTSSRRCSMRWRRGSGRPGAIATCSRRPRDRAHRWLADRRHRRDRGGVPGSRGHALRDLPVYRPHGPDPAARSRGRGDREAPSPARGWRVIGTRESASRTGERRSSAPRPRPRAAGRALRPRSVLRLALPVLRLRGLRGRRGARAAQPGRGVPRRGPDRARPARDALDAAFGPAAVGPRWRPSTSAAGRRRSCPPTRSSGCSRACATGSGSLPMPRSRSRPTPGPDERGDPAALRRAGITRVSFGAQSLDDGELRKLGPAPPVPNVAEAVAGARAAGIPSVTLDLLTTCPDTDLPTWIDTLEGALALGPDHLSLYALTLDDPDAEGLTAPTGITCPRARGAPLARGARATAGRGPGGGPIPPRVLDLAAPGSAATRSRTGRVQVTRAGTTSRTGNGAA